MKAFKSSDVAAVFKAYPESIRGKLMSVRQLIFDTAFETDGVGELEETLKWGEPAYLTTKSRSGSTVRIDQNKANKSQYAVYFNCHTNLVDSFRALFPATFKFEGDRAIVFDADESVSVDELRACIAMALTYHRRAKSKST